MHAQIIDIDYQEKPHNGFLLASDLHIGSKGHDIDLCRAEFDKAVNHGYQILINGDWGEFIISGDRKRYHPGGDKYNADNPINRTIDEAVEFLTPYAKSIVFIGHGNHEVSVSKFHGLDVTQSLIALLNHKTGSNIKHGQYRGMVRFQFHCGKNGKRCSVTMAYNHGQGASAEITRGAIGLNRMMSSYDAQIFWTGHSHTKLCLPCENVVAMSANGDIITKERKGIVTGAYVKTVHTYDAQAEGYGISYGEERMRTIQSTGGYFLTFDAHRSGNDITIKTRVVEP